MANRNTKNIDEDAEVDEFADVTVNERNLTLRRRYLEIETERKAALEAGDTRVADHHKYRLDGVGTRFIEDNEGLARSMARIFIRPGETNAEDYIQDAREGLWQAFTKWDPARGVTFGTFSRLYLTGKVHRGVRTMEYGQISHSDFGAAKHVKDAVRDLTDKLGRTPSNSEVAAATELTEALVARVRVGKAVSLDTPVGDGEGTLGDIVGTRAAVEMSEMDEDAWWKYLSKITEGLTADELLILARREGWDSSWKQSLVEVSSLTGEGRGTVSRKESSARGKLTGPAPAPLV